MYIENVVRTTNCEWRTHKHYEKIYNVNTAKTIMPHISQNKLVSILILIILFFVIILTDISYSEETGKSDNQELKPSTTLPSGIVTADSLEIEPTIQAYNCVADALEIIVRKLEAFNNKIYSGSNMKEKKILIITNEKILADCLLYKQVVYILNTTYIEMENLYKKINLTSWQAAAFPGTVPGFLIEFVNKTLCVTDFLGLFKTEIALKGKAVSIDEFALTNLAAKKLHDREIYNVYDSTFIALEPINFSNDDDELKKALEKCEEYKSKLKQITPKNDQKEEIKKLIDRFDKFMEGFEKPGDNGITPHSRLLLPSIILHLKPDYYLYLKPIYAGGTTRSRKLLFTTGDVSYSGGAIVGYYIVDAKAEYIEESRKIGVEYRGIVTSLRDFKNINCFEVDSRK